MPSSYHSLGPLVQDHQYDHTRGVGWHCSMGWPGTAGGRVDPEAERLALIGGRAKESRMDAKRCLFVCAMTAWIAPVPASAAPSVGGRGDTTSFAGSGTALALPAT